MGHLGLTPQSIYKFGTYSVRAKEEKEMEKLKSDVIKLEKAGCFAIVLDKIPAELAKTVTESVKIPIIGIGAGANGGYVLALVGRTLAEALNQPDPLRINAFYLAPVA